MTEHQKECIHAARNALLNAIIKTPVTLPIYEELNEVIEWLEEILMDKTM